MSRHWCPSVHNPPSIIRSNPPCRQNAELARLRQDCVRLNRELSERTDALRADEARRKSLEEKMAAAEVRNERLL